MFMFNCNWYRVLRVSRRRGLVLGYHNPITRLYSTNKCITPSQRRLFSRAHLVRAEHANIIIIQRGVITYQVHSPYALKHQWFCLPAFWSQLFAVQSHPWGRRLFYNVLREIFIIVYIIIYSFSKNIYTINVKKLQFIHTVNGDGLKTAKITKRQC